MSPIEQMAEKVLSTGVGYGKCLGLWKAGLVNAALKKHHGNQCETARELGMHRNTLSRTMAELKAAGCEIVKLKRYVPCGPRKKPSAILFRAHREKSYANGVNA